MDEQGRAHPDESGSRGQRHRQRQASLAVFRSTGLRQQVRHHNGGDRVDPGAQARHGCRQECGQH